jgi:hypothetical protein
MRRLSMSLPHAIRVKISSEDVASIGLTPVVSQDMPLDELVMLMLGVTGKDPARIQELLARGSLVSGASRFRWTGFDVLEREVAAYLMRYPDSDPSITFDPAGCFLMHVHLESKQLAIERAAGEKKRMFKRRSFWEDALSLVSAPEYKRYSYRDAADVYCWRPDAPAQARLQEAAKLLAFSSYEAQIRSGAVTAVDLFVKRSEAT